MDNQKPLQMWVRSKLKIHKLRMDSEGNSNSEH